MVYICRSSPLIGDIGVEDPMLLLACESGCIISTGVASCIEVLGRQLLLEMLFFGFIGLWGYVEMSVGCRGRNNVKVGLLKNIVNSCCYLLGQEILWKWLFGIMIVGTKSDGKCKSTFDVLKRMMKTIK